MIIEENDLILNGIRPIFPIMDAWSRNEIVRNTLIKKFLMKVAVDLIKEITSTTIYDEIERLRSQQMSKINDSILLPSLWILLNRAKTLRDSPFLREGRISTPPDILPAEPKIS